MSKMPVNEFQELFKWHFICTENWFPNKERLLSLPERLLSVSEHLLSVEENCLLFFDSQKSSEKHNHENDAHMSKKAPKAPKAPKAKSTQSKKN